MYMRPIFKTAITFQVTMYYSLGVIVLNEDQLSHASTVL